MRRYDGYRWALVGLAVVSLAACSDDNRPTRSAAELDATVTTSTSPASTATTTSTTTTTEPAREPLILRPTGIGNLTFGANADRVVAAISARLGPSTKSSADTGCESGADRTERWPGLYAVFTGDRWDGYVLSSTDLAAATETGVKVGASLAEVRAAYPTVEVMETSLGDEWLVDFGGDRFITGTLSGSGPAEKVRDIGAGDRCVFR